MKPKDQGTRYESAVVARGNERHDLGLNREVLHGKADQGDIRGRLKFQIIECKSGTKPIKLSEGLNQAVVEAENAGVPFHWYFQKRDRHSIGKGYAIMEVDQAFELMALVESLPLELIERYLNREEKRTKSGKAA